jgi:chitinase
MIANFLIVLVAIFAVFSKAGTVTFSPYKDVTINMDWNTYTMTTAVTGSRSTVLSVLPSSGADTVTWAFATGSCGSENWGGINGTVLANANVKSWEAAGAKYIISTGGASGTFRCTSDADFITFINRYNSNSLIGVDFDIEGGQSASDIDSLVQRIQNAQKTFPNLRFSFTLACYGGNANPILGTYGIMVMDSIKKYGLTNYKINLMAMDYGSAIASNCVVGSDNLCDMGLSAIQAAKSLHEQYNLPYSQIEITPMIGGNDTPNETFNTADIDEVTSFVLANGVSAVHHWSFDRDMDCAPGYASPTCNSYGQAGTLGFTKKFAANLGGYPIPDPVPVPVPAPVPSPVPAPTQPVPSPVSPPTTPSDICNQYNCHSGCLWIYDGGSKCYNDYPQAACEVYVGQGYYWCV